MHPMNIIFNLASIVDVFLTTIQQLIIDSITNIYLKKFASVQYLMIARSLSVCRTHWNFILFSNNFKIFVELNTELFPKDLETIKKATHFRNIIDEIPITILTVGSFIHKISIEDPKPPFTWSIIQYIINGEKQASTYVHQKAELYPEFRGSLLNKAVYLKSQHNQIVNFQEFKRIITDCDDVFDQIEAELSTNSGDSKYFE